MGGGGAVILIILVTAIAIPTAIRCRNKKAVALETNPNEAYGLHSSNPSSKQTEDDLYDNVYPAISTEPFTSKETNLHANVAYGFHTAHVTVSSNQAYGVTSAKEGEENEYEYTDHI